MEYDNLGRLTKGKANIAEFAYDALGRRIWKYNDIANEGTFYYYNDKWQVLCEYDNSALQQWYAYGNYIDEVLKLVKLGTATYLISAEQWRKELNAGIDETELGRIRGNTHTGRPLGSDSFLSKLEKLLGRRVRPLPVGRPTKKRMKMSK
jgi:hypothetical protein